MLPKVRCLFLGHKFEIQNEYYLGWFKCSRCGVEKYFMFDKHADPSGGIIINGVFTHKQIESGNPSGLGITIDGAQNSIQRVEIRQRGQHKQMTEINVGRTEIEERGDGAIVLQFYLGGCDEAWQQEAAAEVTLIMAPEGARVVRDRLNEVLGKDDSE